MPAEVTKKCLDPTTEKSLEKTIYQARSKRLLETPILDEIIDISAKITPNIPTEIAKLALDLGQRAASQQSNKCHIIRQRLQIAEVPITEVDYEYESNPSKPHGHTCPCGFMRVLLRLIHSHAVADAYGPYVPAFHDHLNGFCLLHHSNDEENLWPSCAPFHFHPQVS